MLAIVQTDIQEAIEYLESAYSIFQIILLGGLIFAFLAISVCIGSKWVILSTFDNKISKRIITVIFLVLAIIIWKNHTSFFPFDVYADLHSYSGITKDFSDMAKNIKDNDQHLALMSSNTLANCKPGTVIVVVGESANRDYMSAFNASYSFNTTPWELQMKGNPQFVFFPYAYSNYPSTAMSLSQALTAANQYNQIPLGKAADILTVAQKAGYHTYWFSTQRENGISDATITVVARQAETIKWLSGRDDELLDAIKTIPADENNFIVLHFHGSHQKYKQRFPETFAAKYSFNAPSQVESDYDTSLAFTDQVLKQIFDYSKKNMHLQAMVYFSDHGDNLQYGHTMNPFYWEMIHIPFWIYVSPEYVSAYPETLKVLRQHSQSVFTNDLVFDTVSGILHAPSSQYSPRYDISNSEYDITLDTAKAIRGSMNVKDDPAISG